MITFCIDFGNTRQKVGIFSGQNLQEVIVLRADLLDHFTELIEQYKPDKSILSSVIDHEPELENILTRSTAFHKLNIASKLPFTSPVGKPETIGADRLALASAATFFYPEKNVLIIALGSCITYNFINKNKEFIGGSISPGMEMRFKSMNDFTAKLPLVHAEWDFPEIGYDTKTNLISGVVIGMSNEIDGFISLYSNKFSNFNALLTGGDCAYFAPRLKNKIFADPNLIFKGLYAISEINHDTKT
jgi:type III pantothenate kinase